jgi:dTDP-4-dehydrorhamnose reductase
MKVLILGASGMLGHMLFSELFRRDFDVYGTLRKHVPYRKDWQGRLLAGVDAFDFKSVVSAIDIVESDVIVNAIGLIRHLPEGREPLQCIKINAEFPHLLLKVCRERSIRLIHYSTDCVFDGHAGRPYTEVDRPTATDIYGLTKFIGEVSESPALTIRTSIIGPELRGKHSLLEWFLSQRDRVRGFTGAIYTGLPTSEHARLLADIVLPHADLHGLYHVVSTPISKFDLLKIIGLVYDKPIVIDPDGTIQEDKSLSGDAFRIKTGYVAPSWPTMISFMHDVHAQNIFDWS